MEVMRVRDKRRELIDEILKLAERARRPVRPIQICQLCGHDGEPWGWAGTLAMHRHVSEFVAIGHGHGTPQEIAAQPDARDVRWCSWCAVQIAFEPRRFGEPRLCGTCAADGREHHLGHELAARRLRSWETRALVAMRDDLDGSVALDGTARSRELAVARLTIKRLARRALSGLRAPERP